MKKYSAILIDETIENQRSTGELCFQSDQLIFSNATLSRSILFENLEIKPGGANNRMIFFLEKGNPNFSIYTDQHSVLKNEILLQIPSLNAQLKKTKKTSKRFVYSILVVVAVMLLLILSVVLSKDWMVREVAEKVPTSWEKKAGDQLFTLIQSDHKLVEMDSLKTVFLQVAKPLIDQARKKGVEVEVYFSNNHSINAFALPGGKVVIQYGLIENAKSWEEVMGVMGHELAHVTERHHVRSIINSLGIYAVISAMIGDVSAIAGTILSSGGDLASLSNSRKFETEADEQGLEFLMQAHINPQGLIDFFGTLDKEHQKNQMENLSFLSTHPVTKDRIAHLKKIIASKKSVYAPLPSNFSSFKKSFKLKI